MHKKVFAIVGIVALLAVNAAAQRPLKMAKVTEALTGGVPSAFSQKAPLSFVGADVLGRKIISAQFAQTNPIYISSAQLFERVNQAQGIAQLPLAEQLKLNGKFSSLDMAVKTAPRKTSYFGALWEQDPITTPDVLAMPNVRAMTDLLDVQRYMQTNEGVFPQLFSIGPDGFLFTAQGLESQDGTQAFMGMLSILIKEQHHTISPVIVEQLTSLRKNARNAADIDGIVKQLENWRNANNDPTGAPQLPLGMEGVTLRSNPEGLWLATEIRLLQLTPGIELPEVLKTAQVARK